MTTMAPSRPSTVDAKRKRSRRWLRFATPFLVVAAFWAITAGVHLYEEPDRGDPGTLSPTGTSRHGSSQLANMLRDKGITVQRVTTSDDVARAAAGSDATIFVPAPDFLSPGFLTTWTAAWTELPGDHRIVLVQPGRLTTFTLGPPVGIRHSRWTTAITPPNCPTDYAPAAGPAGVRHDVYDADSPDTLCYGGSLVSLTDEDLEIVYIGATDPFRNDRIAEHGNAALAAALLGGFPKVVWVDVHHREPLPAIAPPDISFKLPDYEREDRNRTNTGNPVIDAFPAPFWAALILLATGGLLLAVARARRLGPPVSEPLPVLVPASEAVTGRGRLYQRISARRPSLDALRVAAISRLARLLDPFAGIAPERELLDPGPAADRFVQQVATRAGWDPAHVHDVLYGHSPTDDEELVHAVARLDLLVHTVIQGGTP